jgi:site-specific recombinase XerD
MKENHQLPISNKQLCPLPLFDTMLTIKKIKLTDKKKQDFAEDDFDAARTFLKEYDGNQATFNSYRREIERLLQWSWLIERKSILQLRRDNIESYIQFCKNPPVEWIGIAKVARFIDKDGARVQNPAWRPFVVTISKTAVKNGKSPNTKQYELSEKSIREIFAILSSFYNFLIQESYTEINPLLQIRQKSKFFRKRQGHAPIRRLTELQWDTVIEIAQSLADAAPHKYERTLFILSALYSMYLRISELVASARWLPKMCDFHRDHDGHWWFTTVGKGNKERQIAVSDSMLAALKRWRKYLGCNTVLPSVDEKDPLIPKDRGEGAITSTNQIRNIVQYCFDQAIIRLFEDGFKEEAKGLQSATVHWLRHTGISDDVKRRPREHVRDDAGHSSSVTTDKYIDVDSRERHASAKKKLINKDDIVEIKNIHIKTSKVKKNINTIYLSLWLVIENNSKWVRGKKKVREDIEHHILSEYNMRKLGKDSNDYEISIDYKTEEELENTIRSIYSQMQWKADMRNCQLEVDIRDKNSERAW